MWSLGDLEVRRSGDLELKRLIRRYGGQEFRRSRVREIYQELRRCVVVELGRCGDLEYRSWRSGV